APSRCASPPPTPRSSSPTWSRSCATWSTSPARTAPSSSPPRSPRSCCCPSSTDLGRVSSCAGPGATAPRPASCPCTGRSAPRDGTRTTRTRCSPRCASSGPAGTARISRSWSMPRPPSSSTRSSPGSRHSNTSRSTSTAPAPTTPSCAGPRRCGSASARARGSGGPWPCGDGTGHRELLAARAAVSSAPVPPRLAALEHLTAHAHGTRPDHTELRGTPALRIRQREEPGRRDPDWFDLGFEITLGDVPVSFAAVFTALSRGREAVLMPDRSYFRLDHPTFDALRELIAEGQAMAEWEPEVQRISRHQVTLWEALEDLAEHTEQAQAWAASVGALGRISHLPSPAP